jgi:hypothetical protein
VSGYTYSESAPRYLLAGVSTAVEQAGDRRSTSCANEGGVEAAALCLHTGHRARVLRCTLRCTLRCMRKRLLRGPPDHKRLRKTPLGRGRPLPTRRTNENPRPARRIERRPGYRMIGGVGATLSSATHDDRSNRRNSSAFSWAVRSPVAQPLGNAVWVSADTEAT